MLCADCAVVKGLKLLDDRIKESVKLKEEILEKQGHLAHESHFGAKRISWKGMKNMLVTIGVSRRMLNKKNPVDLLRNIECTEPRNATLYEGSLGYEHGPHGDDAETENAMRNQMLSIAERGFTVNPQYGLLGNIGNIPAEEPEPISIADLGYITIGRDEYDWTHDSAEVVRDRAFARFEILDKTSSRMGYGARRMTVPNAEGMYEQAPPLIQRLTNISTDGLHTPRP